MLNINIFCAIVASIYNHFLIFLTVIPAKSEGENTQIHTSYKIPEIHCDFYISASSACALWSDIDLSNVVLFATMRKKIQLPSVALSNVSPTCESIFQRE